MRPVGDVKSGITAITEAVPFDGVTGLHADGEFGLSYNAAGDMVSDASRGLLHTRWNADGHPVQYDLEGGHRQSLGWDGLGVYDGSRRAMGKGWRCGCCCRGGRGMC